jgi:L-amino acid N-acyltransferase YncA
MTVERAVELRDAKDADVPRIVAILNQAIRDTTASWDIEPTTIEARRGWLRDRQAKDFPVLVAVSGGEIAGFGSFGDFRSWQGYHRTVEHSLYVDPTHQRCGVGAALLNALVERARSRGMHAMVAGIEAGNAASITLHLRAGFEEAGRLREVGRKFDRWLDLVLMQRILAP